MLKNKHVKTEYQIFVNFPKKCNIITFLQILIYMKKCILQ